MSLIADALKKAQSAKLGRKYRSLDPAGVLPVSSEVQSGKKKAVGFISSWNNNVPTMVLLGTGSGIILFTALFSYFYWRGGAKPSGQTRALAKAEKKLILTPPPLVPAVEPLSFEQGSSLAKEPTPPPEKQDLPPRSFPSSTGEAAPPPVKTESKSPSQKVKSIPPKTERTKVTVASDLSEEVRYRFNLALLYQEERNFLQARKEYEKVVELWPLYTEAHNNLAVVYKELGMYDMAQTQLKKAIALNPRYARAYHNLAVIFQLKGDLPQAAKNYLTVLSLDHNHLASYNNLGLVYRADRRLPEARALLEKALTLDSAHPQTHYNLALILEETGETEQARFHYQKFIDLSGDENRSLVERVKARLQELAMR